MSSVDIAGIVYVGVIFAFIAGSLLYYGRKSKARRNAKLAQEMARRDTRIIPWHLMDSATRQHFEEEQRERFNYGLNYQQARRDFENLAPYMYRATALMTAPRDENEQRHRVELAELMIQRIRPGLERLHIELPDDAADLYSRMDQLWQLAKDGRLKLAQAGMKGEQIPADSDNI